MKLTIIIPAHNEEANVEKIIKLLLENFNKNINEIIIVNDCSTDKTGAIINKLAKKNSKIVPLHRKKDGGVGNAIRLGLKSISQKSDYILTIDCDFTENIKNIKKMIEIAGTADGILGSRYMKDGILENYPLLKKIANRSFHILIRLFLNIPHVDVTNNFKLYKTTIIKKIMPFLTSRGFSINAETGIYPIMMGFKIKEIPVSWIGRTPEMGKSSFNVIKAGPGYVKVFLTALKLKYLSKLNKGEEEHFNALVEKTGETYYGNLRPIAQIRFKRKAKAILKLIETPKNCKILEIGCGTGILSKYLLRNNPSLNIEGIDISSKAIEIANKDLKKYKNVHFQTGDITHLPFRNRSFDIVIGNSILHHVPLEQTLKEIKRVLKPKGKIWFCEPNILNPQIAIEKNLPIVKSFLQDSPNERAFSRWQIKKDLEKNGFGNITTKPYEFLHPLLPKAAFNFLIPFCLLLEKTPLIKEFAGTLEITAEVN